jgi:hypothetical protein
MNVRVVRLIPRSVTDTRLLEIADQQHTDTFEAAPLAS